MPLPSAAVAPLLSVPLPSRLWGPPPLPLVAPPSGPLPLRASGKLPVAALLLNPALGTPPLLSIALFGSDALAGPRLASGRPFEIGPWPVKLFWPGWPGALPGRFLGVTAVLV